MARLLLHHGADPNAGYLWDGRHPFTALTGAFGRGEGNQPPHQHRLELARLLLEAGADPNDSQTLYNCGLGGAGDDDSHIELLFQYGLGRGNGGPWFARLRGLPTPAQLLQDELLRAARHGRLELARLLIEHGVDTNGRGSEHPAYGGHTAHEFAMLHGNPEIAELLAAAGATTTAQGPVHTFLSACMRADRPAIERLLAADPALVATAIAREPYLIGRAAETGRADAVRLMAELGFDVNLGDALVYRQDCPSVMGFLGELDPCVKVVQRATALHLAAWRGDLAVVRTLVELGADPNLLDTEHHSTPRGWTEYNHQHEVAAYLASLPGSAHR